VAVNALLLRPVDWRTMREHVIACLPEEACGLLGGRAGRVLQVYPVPNALHSPVRYRMEAQAQVRAQHDIERCGWRLLGVYHSHPRGPAAPSSTDVAEAACPECAWLIWSRDTTGAWQCRAFRIAAGDVTPLPLYLQLPGGNRVIASVFGNSQARRK